MTAARPAVRQPAATASILFVRAAAAAALVLALIASGGTARAVAASTDASFAPGTRLDLADLARREAERAGIRRPGLFVRQLAAESRYEPCVGSPAGAIGVAQIMPATAREWGVDPWDPAAAIRAAAEHMASYEREFGSYSLALAAYNAGPGAVHQYGGVPPYSETRGYVRKITRVSTELPGLDTTIQLADGFTPTFDARLRALQDDVAARGGRLLVRDGWRSWAVQDALWQEAKRRWDGFSNARARVTPPACSAHVRGEAAEVVGNLRLARSLASSHGLVLEGRHTLQLA